MLDWGDACVSHPFFTLSVTLEGGLAWGLDDVEDSVDIRPFRDAYLKPFADRYAGDLVEAATVALRLGWACRAVNGHIPGDNARPARRSPLAGRYQAVLAWWAHFFRIERTSVVAGPFVAPHSKTAERLTATRGRCVRRSATTAAPIESA